MEAKNFETFDGKIRRGYLSMIYQAPTYKPFWVGKPIISGLGRCVCDLILGVHAFHSQDTCSNV